MDNSRTTQNSVPLTSNSSLKKLSIRQQLNIKGGSAPKPPKVRNIFRPK